MFGSIGGAELILILVVALLLFGPRKLPQIGRTLGKGLSEFRKATADFKMNLEREVDLDQLRSTARDTTEAAAEVRQLAVPRSTNTPAASPAPGPPGGPTPAAENGAAGAHAPPERNT